MVNNKWKFEAGSLFNVAIDEWLPDKNSQAFGLYLHNGFCLAAIYTHKVARQYWLIIMNCRIGVWLDEK